MYDLLIKNGTIIDGTGEALKQADLAIQNGKIMAIGDLKKERAKEEINAEAKYVVPGFLDIHNDADHDLSLILLPRADNLLRQGITTIIGGNCGASLAPLINPSLIALDKWLEKPISFNISWRTLKEFLAFLEKKQLGINFGTLIGWGSLREEFTKSQFRPLNKEELEKLKLLVQISLKEGAFGVSFGLGYDLEQAVGLKEIEMVAELVQQKKGFLSFHLRNEADGFLASLGEVLEIVERKQVSIEISHLRVAGKDNFDSFTEALKMIHLANQEKELVNFDIFPYDYNLEPISLLLPEWIFIGGRRVLLKNLNNEIIRKKIIEDLKRKKYLYQDLIIADSGERWWFEGKTLKEISENFNLSLEESLLKIIELCEKRVLVLVRNLSADNVKQGILAPESLIASNGTIVDIESNKKGKWVHPRTFGTFPKFLNDYVKEQKLLSWQEAIRKITGKVADKIGLKDRGYLKENYWADIVIFNPEKIKDRASLDNPFQYADGIETVIVNGKIAYHKGIFSHKQYGQVLRKN